MSVATLYHHKRLIEAPAPATPTQGAGSNQTLLGFWCIPHEQVYLKVPIRSSYTLNGRVTVEVFDQGSINAVWAILTNINALSKHFTWVRDTAYKVSKTWGAQALSDPTNPKHQQALAAFQREALNNDWTYVVTAPGRANVAYIGFRWMPAYALALHDELSDPNKAQKPERFRLRSAVDQVIGMAPNGKPQAAKNLEDFFALAQGDGERTNPVKALGDLAKMTNVHVDQYITAKTPNNDVGAVKKLIYAVMGQVKAQQLTHRPEAAQSIAVLDAAAKKNFSSFAVEFLKAVKQPDTQQDQPDLRDIAAQVTEILDAYNHPNDFKDPNLQKFAARLYQDTNLYNQLQTVLSHEYSQQLRKFLTDFARWYQANKHNLNQPPAAPHTPKPPVPSRPQAGAPQHTPPTAESIMESSFVEWSFRQLYQSTGSNGLYKRGGMRKVTTTGNTGEVRTAWIFDPSVPGRVDNSKFVVTKPPTPAVGPDGLVTIKFNFKSRPDRSTTNMRAVGFIKFLPQGRRGRPNVEVDREVQVYCSCPDFKYRWHKALADSGAAHTPTGIGGEATNANPVKTNPGKKISMCKHLCAMYDYLGQTKADYLATMGQDKGRVSKTGKSIIPVGPSKPARIKQGAKAQPSGKAEPTGPETP